jgi:hypothetical protein
VVNIIVNLQWFKLGIENLDHLILIVKNWPNDDCVGCALNPKNTSYSLTFETNTIKQNKNSWKPKGFLKKTDLF